MAKELAFAIITPHTIRKSRTGAVLSRLLGGTSARLVGAQMVALDREMADLYANSIAPVEDVHMESFRSLLREYIRENLGPTVEGHRSRALLLVFYGEEARDEIAELAGRFTISATSGETIRNAYGDLVYNADGSVRYFEPAVLISDPAVPTRQEMQIWIDYLRQQPSLLENVCEYEHPERVEQTLALIKPDSWRQRSAKPGAIIDMFSKTGLRIIGCRLCRISVSEALEFYGPVRQVLCAKLSPSIAAKARETLEEAFNLVLPASADAHLREAVGIPFAEDQFERIIEFMSGCRPSECPAAEREANGTVSCLALVYEGEDAVSKIRAVLGPTDPTKAPDGTVRREFGLDVMVNTAHASDSPENAQREIGILKLRQSHVAAEIEVLLGDL